MEEIKRGEIRYIDIPYSVGHEMAKDRPGIILGVPGGDANIATVVYLTSVKSKRVLPTHVTINSSGTSSWAKCEHIATVDMTRVKNCIGKCSDVEMKRVEAAIRFHLGLSRFGEYQESTTRIDSEAAFEASRVELEQLEKKCISLENEREHYRNESVRVAAQRDLYKELYEKAMDGSAPVKEEAKPKKPPKPTFGSRLKEARETNKLSQSQLANKCGVPKSTLSYWESNSRAPKMEQAVAVAKALNVDLAWLCCMEG